MMMMDGRDGSQTIGLGDWQNKKTLFGVYVGQGNTCSSVWVSCPSVLALWEFVSPLFNQLAGKMSQRAQRNTF